MFRNFESGKEKERNPFGKKDSFEDDIWGRRDRLWEMLENRKTSDPHDNFFSSGPKRIALEGEVYYSPINKTIYVGKKNGSWTVVNGLKEVQTNFVGSSFIVNSAFTGIGTALGNIKNNGFALADDLKSFEATSFHPKGSYEFNKIASGITDGKIYIQGTAKSISTLERIAYSAEGLGYAAGVVAFYLSYKEFRRNQISGEILALDGVMTILSFTGPGAFVAGVYFILIRTDTKDKYFSHKQENIYESAKVKIDNTRVDMQGHKLILK